MSAFIVGHQTMQWVVSSILLTPETANRFDVDILDHAVRETGHQLGEQLFAMNCEAIRQRYRDMRGKSDVEVRGHWCPGEPSVFNWDGPFAHLNMAPEAFIKAICCLTYQCAEGNVPESNPLFAKIESHAGQMAMTVVRNSPAWNSAPWGI